LITAFTTVFFVFGLGFVIQRLRPLTDQTLKQLSGLVVEILLPSFLFFTTATAATPESLGVAPALVVAGIVVPLFGYLLATLAIKPSGVADAQRSVFRFSIMIANTAFLGIPICVALFGPIGAVYAVLYDFGTTLVAMTLGIWELKGGRLDDWRPLIFNPLIWGVLVGLLWAVTGWKFPVWLATPFERLGDTTLPLALLVAGAQISNVRTPGAAWRRQLTGLTITRLAAVPIIVAFVFAMMGRSDLFSSVVVIQAAMPVGLTVSIMARNYEADGEFAASAILWSTLAALISLPLVTILLN